MKRFLSPLGLAVMAFAATALSAFADEPRAAVLLNHHAAFGHGLARLQRCLSNLDLSADQQAAIQAIVSAATATLQSDAQAVRADRQQTRSDIESGADKCVVGQDVLTEHADATKIRNDVQAVRDQVLAKLTTDQQNKLKDCLQTFGPNGRAVESYGHR